MAKNPNFRYTVGKLRQQSALCGASNRVVIISSDPNIRDILSTLEVTDMFSDTTNENGEAGEPTFKIKVSKRLPPSPNG